ncbi:hypothetical protein MITS9504_00250 [Synechococcus sp. MIT S9504]|nr:hypothetical protein [Synechococcus sp. MIT S9504]KZR87826.1 hypothetical protein MITS9504_00250 [Synechococcus sp. MIT S9504]
MDDLKPSLAELICSAADLCRKPLIHALVPFDQQFSSDQAPISNTDSLKTMIDLSAHLECRDPDGSRCSEQDLELEIYQSGEDLNLMLSWLNQTDRPLLWHGQHPVWMDGDTGKRCSAPNDGAPLEALARRLRALLV